MDDVELLHKYVQDHSQEAFAELARRYVNLVYSAALRQVHDRHVAEDVTQSVFLILSKKAGEIAGRGVLLSAWLLLATRYAARDVKKGDARRRQREQKAAAMSNRSDASENSDSDSTDWEKVSPLLDDAMARLAESLRWPLVLRFFENKSFREVAQRLQITEPAARQRVTRAVQQLRAILAEGGMAVPAATLETLLISHAVHAAPAELAGGLAALAGQSASASVRGAATVAKTGLVGLLPLAGKAAVVVLVVGAVAAGTYKLLTRPSGVAMSVVAPGSAAPGAGRGVKRSAGLHAVIKAPDGKVVAGAEVALARASSAATVYGPQPSGVLTVRSADDGSFTLPSPDDATAIVVRADEGFAQVTTGDVLGEGVIPLEPWASIEGDVRAAGKVLANHKVYLSRLGGSIENWNRWRVMHEAQTVTDDMGHFSFAQVAPGEISLHVAGAQDGWGRTLHITARAGKHVDLHIGGSGRAITGRVEVKDDLPPFHGSLFASRPTTAPTTKPSQTSVVVNTQLGFRAAADGSFRVDDVPPGNYILVLQSLENANGTQFPETLALAQMTLSVPQESSASAEPLDVGVLKPRLNPTLRIGEDAPQFAAAPVDSTSDQVIQLSDLKGKYVLVDFIYPEAGNPWASMAGLRAIYDRYSDDPRFMMLTVTIDGAAQKAKAYRDSNAIEWQVAAARPVAQDKSIFDIGAMLSSRPVPDIYLHTPTHMFLIGPDGKLIAKSLTGRAAYETLDRVLSALRGAVAGGSLSTTKMGAHDSATSIVGIRHAER